MTDLSEARNTWMGMAWGILLGTVLWGIVAAIGWGLISLAVKIGL